MIEIIIFSCVIGVLSLILIWKVFSLIRNKIKNVETNYVREFWVLGLLFVASGILTIHTIYLGFALVKDNKEYVVEFGKNVITSSVEFGATAVLEGLGNTHDYFKSKWEKSYLSELRQLTIEIGEMDLQKLDEDQNDLFIDLIVINKNDKSRKISMNAISANNYILICDEDELYYPLEVSNENQSYYLPVGKSLVKMKCSVPSGKSMKFIRFVDEKISIPIK